MASADFKKCYFDKSTAIKGESPAVPMPLEGERDTQDVPQAPSGPPNTTTAPPAAPAKLLPAQIPVRTSAHQLPRLEYRCLNNPTTCTAPGWERMVPDHRSSPRMRTSTTHLLSMLMTICRRPPKLKLAPAGQTGTPPWTAKSSRSSTSAPTSSCSAHLTASLLAANGSSVSSAMRLARLSSTRHS